MPDFYGTVDNARIYWDARGYDVGAAGSVDNTVAQWLLNASEWIDGRYVGSFPGWKVGMRDQVREWPRYSAFDRYGYAIGYESVPTEIERATYEAAYRVSSGVKLLVDYSPPKYKRASVEGAVSVEYASLDGASAQTVFIAIDQILAGILTGAGAVSPLSGSAVRA